MTTCACDKQFKIRTVLITVTSKSNTSFNICVLPLIVRYGIVWYCGKNYLMILDNRLHDYPHLNLKNPDSYVNSVGPNQLTFALCNVIFLCCSSNGSFFKVIVYYMHQMMSYDLSMIMITDIKFSIY